MATCKLCPEDDNQIPDEMFLEHMMLLHRNVEIKMLPLEAPDGADPEEAQRWMPVIGAALMPILHKVTELEQKGFAAYSAGFKDGFGESVERAVDCLREKAAKIRDKDDTLPGLELGLLRAAEHVQGHIGEMLENIPDMITAGDILRALNDGEAPDYSELEIAVACAPATEHFDYKRQAMVEGESWFPFTQGEIIVVNSDGREPWGEQRHCRKWGIEFEYFKTLEAARERQATIRKDRA